MVLTDRQRADLHAGIYEYLLSRNGKHFEEAADALAEADPDCVRIPVSRQAGSADDNASVGSMSSRFSRMTTASSYTSKSANLPILERKWTAVPRLQRKVLELERTLAQNAKVYAHRSSATGGGIVNAGNAVQRRMLPRHPNAHTLQGHSGNITCVAIHPTFTTAVSGSEDGTVKVWDHESGEYIKTLKGHTNTVRSVAFTPTGTHLASSSSDLSIKLWDFDTYTCVRTLRGHDHTISAVVFVPNQLMSQGGPSANTIRGEATSTGIESSAAGTSYLVSASRDKTIKFWDVETGFVDHTIDNNNDWIRCLAVRACDGELLASAGNDRNISVYKTGGNRQKVTTLIGHEHVVESLSFIIAPTPPEKKKYTCTDEQKDYLASGGRDRSVRLWNVATSTCLAVFKYHENWVRSVLVHPSGKYIISAGDDRSIKVMDIEANRCLRTLEDAHPHFVTSLAMHHTLPVMVSGGVDQCVNCWQLD